MNKDEINNWIDGIRKSDKSGDHEEAHMSEDALLWEFIRSVADNGYVYSSRAKIILDYLETSDEPRWMA